MHWLIHLERKTVNRLNPEITRSKLRTISGVVERNKAFGFTGKLARLTGPEAACDAESGVESYLYRAVIRVESESVGDLTQAQFEHSLAALQKEVEKAGWDVVEGETEEPTTLSPEPRPQFIVPELTEAVLEEHFFGIYERDSHIRLIHDSVKAYCHSLELRKTNPGVKVSRGHVLLRGRPAGCKSTLFERFKRWYDSTPGGVERVLFIDAHTTSRAGLENFLLEKAEANSLPEVVVFEEVDKQHPDNLLSLLSVMASGYISKTNAKIGRRREAADILAWATCNDPDVIQNFRKGALWSRFPNRFFCPRPSKGLVRRILEDRVARLCGDPAWVDCVMAFAYDTVPKWTGRPLDDVRQIEALLDGRERLMTGDYQRDVLEILRAEMGEKKDDSEAGL
jgi:hypothetical protein